MSSCSNDPENSNRPENPDSGQADPFVDGLDFRFLDRSPAALIEVAYESMVDNFAVRGKIAPEESQFPDAGAIVAEHLTEQVLERLSVLVRNFEPDNPDAPRNCDIALSKPYLIVSNSGAVQVCHLMRVRDSRNRSLVFDWNHVYANPDGPVATFVLTPLVRAGWRGFKADSASYFTPIWSEPAFARELNALVRVSSERYDTASKHSALVIPLKRCLENRWQQLAGGRAMDRFEIRHAYLRESDEIRIGVPYQGEFHGEVVPDGVRAVVSIYAWGQQQRRVFLPGLDAETAELLLPEAA